MGYVYWAVARFRLAQFLGSVGVMQAGLGNSFFVYFLPCDHRSGCCRKPYGTYMHGGHACSSFKNDEGEHRGGLKCTYQNTY